MPFVAECIFCSGKVRVPDHAVGWSIPCPKCGNNFTIAKPTGKKQSAIKSGAEQPNPAALSAAGTVIQDKQKNVPSRKIVKDPSSKTIVSIPKKRLNRLGVGSLFCGSMAMFLIMLPSLATLFMPLYGWVRWLNMLVIPLGGIGLLLGLFGIVAPRLPYITGRFLPFVGVFINVTAFVFLFIGTRWLYNLPPIQGPGIPAVPAGKITFLPSGGTGSPKLIDETEWSDASAGSLQKENIRVRVKKAELRHMTVDKKKTKSKELYLVISVQLSNSGTDISSQYDTWRSSNHLAVLTDDQKRSYKHYAPKVPVETLGGIAKASLPPMRIAEDILIFEAPKDRDKLESLMLELPAHAIGKTGNLRFQIPMSMVTKSEK